MASRSRSTARAAALTMVLALGGCGSSGARVSVEDRSVVAAGPAVSGPPRARTLVDLLPAGATFAVGISGMQLRSSQLYAQLAPMVKDELRDELARIESQCGLDPFTAIQNVLVAGTIAGDSTTLVVTGIARKDLTRCVLRLAELDGRPVELVEDGDFTRIHDGGETIWIGWWSDTALVFSPKAGREFIADRIAGTRGVRTSATMAALLDKVAIEAGLWLVFANDMSSHVMPPSMRALYVTMDFVTGLKLDGALGMADPETAATTAQSMAQQLDAFKTSPMGNYLAKLELVASGSDVVMRLDLTESEVMSLVQQLGGSMDLLRLFNP